MERMKNVLVLFNILNFDKIKNFWSVRQTIMLYVGLFEKIVTVYLVTDCLFFSVSIVFSVITQCS